jgi:hypothetical protein
MDEIKTPKNDLASLLRDFAQGASNSVAGNVAVPVDAIAWLLRKGGVNVPLNPVMGSDWMAEKGLTREPQNKLAGFVGDMAGMVAPFAAASKAPQIAKGLLAAGDAMPMGSKGVPALSKASPMADRGAIGNFTGNAYYESPEIHQQKIADLYRAFGNFGGSQSGMSPQIARSLHERGLLKVSKKERDLLLDMTDSSGAIRPQVSPDMATGNERLLKILERNGQTP